MIALPDTIALFPLGEVVLFPDTVLPLQIFEPRYRTMLSDVLESEQPLIGIILSRRVPSGQYGGGGRSQPDLYSEGCAGKIVEHQKVSETKYVVVLRGVAKFKVLSELETDTAYRQAKIQALYEAPARLEDQREWARQLRLRIDVLLSAMGQDEQTKAGARAIFEAIAERDLVNTLSASLPLGILEKQSLLECATIEARFQQLLELIAFKEAEIRLGVTTDGSPQA